MYVLVRYLYWDHTALECLMSKFLLVSLLYLEGRSWLCLILNLNSSAKFMPFFDGQRVIGKSQPSAGTHYLEERAGGRGVIGVGPPMGRASTPGKRNTVGGVRQV